MIIPEVTQAEGIRVFQEKVDLFNAASRGAITLGYDPSFLAQFGGDYIEPVVFARPSGGDRHTDEADPTGASTAAAITQAKGATVLQSRHDYYSWNRDEVMRGKMTPEQYSLAIGDFIANDKILALRNNIVAAGVAAIDSMDTTDGSTASLDIHILDVARGKAGGAKVKFTFARLNTLLGKLADAREDIVTILMPSPVLVDLIADGLTNYAFDSVAGLMVAKDVPQAMGRTLIVADVPALTSALTSSYYTEYAVLGLGVGALQARIMSEDPIDNTVVTTTKVKSYTVRQDYDVEYAVQAMKWQTVKTHINPTDTELATAARWDEFYGDHREAKLVKGIFNAT